MVHIKPHVNPYFLLVCHESLRRNECVEMSNLQVHYHLILDALDIFFQGRSTSHYVILQQIQVFH